MQAFYGIYKHYRGPQSSAFVSELCFVIFLKVEFGNLDTFNLFSLLFFVCTSL